MNERYVEAIGRHCQPGDFIWVHDYHLMNVALALRGRDAHVALTFFLHIPFPPYDIFAKLPQQQRLLGALLQFDLLGFQTRRDVRNFLQCVRRVLSDAKIRSDFGIQVPSPADARSTPAVSPLVSISSRFKNVRCPRKSPKWARKLGAAFPRCQLRLGLDRLDYSKGIPERLRAFREALDRYPEL